MKTLFANIYKAIATFVTTHTAVAVTTAIAVVAVTVAVPVGIHMARPEPDETSDVSPGITDTSGSAEETTAPEVTTTVPDSTGPDESESSETTDTSEGTTEPEDTSTTEETTTPDETTTPEITTTPEVTTTPQATTKPEETTVPGSTEPAGTEKPEPDPPATTEGETEQPVVVQRADIKTGISRDGVSPIIYTYPDGSTGTEPQIGAAYEVLPGMITTVTKYQMPSDSSEPPKDLSLCDHCGKKGGDGTNGTCLRYWGGGDHICDHCGVTIPVNTCHTCNG